VSLAFYRDVAFNGGLECADLSVLSRYDLSHALLATSRQIKHGDKSSHSKSHVDPSWTAQRVAKKTWRSRAEQRAGKFEMPVEKESRKSLAGVLPGLFNKA
jgi:hypothetical protein